MLAPLTGGTDPFLFHIWHTICWLNSVTVLLSLCLLQSSQKHTHSLCQLQWHIYRSILALWLSWLTLVLAYLSSIFIAVFPGIVITHRGWHVVYFVSHVIALLFSLGSPCIACHINYLVYADLLACAELAAARSHPWPNIHDHIHTSQIHFLFCFVLLLCPSCVCYWPHLHGWLKVLIKG